MKNYLESGDKLTLTAPTGGVVAGTAYDFGTLVVVATRPRQPQQRNSSA